MLNVSHTRSAHFKATAIAMELFSSLENHRRALKLSQFVIGLSIESNMLHGVDCEVTPRAMKRLFTK
jgi:hypothetical protein